MGNDTHGNSGRPEAGKDSSGDSSGGSVVMLSGDLMFASRVRAAAQRAGLAFHFGGSFPEGDLHNVRFVVLDLSTRSGLIGSIAGVCTDAVPRRS